MTLSKKRDEPVATIRHSNAAAEWALSEDRLPVFSVSRVDPANPDAEPELITYTMPAKPNPGLALRFLKMARTMGDAASSWLIETAIGEEGYEALADELINYEGDATQLLQGIAEKIQKVAMGGLDSGPKV